MTAARSWRVRYPALARFMRHRLAVASAIVILLLLATAAFGPSLYHVDATEVDFELLGSPQQPSSTHWAGTDFQGRDLLARLLMGARISLAVGIVSMIINMVIGVGLGMFAGWLGGWMDQVLMRLVDALYSIPLLLIVILLQLFVQPAVQNGMDSLNARFDLWTDPPLLLSPELLSIYLALGLSNWLTMSRLARSEVITQARRDYVAACHALGASGMRILFRHILPNSLGPLLVAATLAIPEAIFIESFLAFIGLGVSSPQASWGTLASDAVYNLSDSPYLLLFPSLAISVTMLAFNLFGDGLRDAFDPSQR